MCHLLVIKCAKIVLRFKDRFYANSDRNLKPWGYIIRELSQQKTIYLKCNVRQSFLNIGFVGNDFLRLMLFSHQNKRIKSRDKWFMAFQSYAMNE